MNQHPTPPLDRPLPYGMTAHATGFLGFYRKYPVFSWPWAWRRTVQLGSLGLTVGLLFGVWHKLMVNDWSEGLAVGWAFGINLVVLVAAGPLLGAAIRHRRLRRPIEASLIVSAVLVGVFCAASADKLANDYHNSRMDEHGMYHPPPPPPEHPDVSWWVQRSLDWTYILGFWFLGSGGIALQAYFAEPRRLRELQRHQELEKLSLQRANADLRLAVLQAQVEPHFLFNTLASVRSLIHSDPPGAARTVEALAEYLRATLPKFRPESSSALSTLGEQFQICESYLKLMQARMGERLRIEVRLPPELRSLPFPPLMLISLVENAIKHGVEPKTGASHVILEAKVREEPKGARLYVEVVDDGAGLRTGIGSGTGLANIRAQLLARFDAAASLELSARDAGGVAARITLPMEQLHT